MKRPTLPDMSMPDVTLPDVSGPDMSGISDTLLDLAGSAADAISGAAALVPGVDDFRASHRRRNVLMTFGAIALVVALVAMLRRRDDDTTKSV